MRVDTERRVGEQDPEHLVERRDVVPVVQQRRAGQPVQPAAPIGPAYRQRAAEGLGRREVDPDPGVAQPPGQRDGESGSVDRGEQPGRFVSV
jgi:hypothetical protein